MRETISDKFNSFKNNYKFYEVNTFQEKISLEKNTVSETEWYDLLSRFRDASLFQTWAYATHQAGGKKCEHLVFREKLEIIAIVQVRIMTLPVIKRGIAYVYWGPVCLQEKGRPGIEVLKGTLHGLYNEYVVKRKLMLRIVPCILEEEKEYYQNVFSKAGLTLNQYKKKDQTIILDLGMTHEEIKKQFRSNWRRYLNSSEKNDLEIISGTDDELFQMFQGLYSELLTIKTIPFPTDMNNFMEIQRKLPEQFKMQVFVCRFEKRPVAGLVVTASKDLGLLLFSATNIEGKKLKSTTLLHWHVINWLKEKGCRWYDLGGINQETNPGCYRFKSGLGGRIVYYLGQYEACLDPLSCFIINTGEYVRKLKHALRLRRVNHSPLLKQKEGCDLRKDP